MHNVHVKVHANEVHDELLAAWAETDDEHAPLLEAAINAARPLVDLVGDPSVDGVVDVKLGVDADKVSITVSRVEGNGADLDAEMLANHAGGGAPDPAAPVPVPDEATLAAGPVEEPTTHSDVYEYQEPDGSWTQEATAEEAATEADEGKKSKTKG